jgi:hypothetical protein
MSTTYYDGTVVFRNGGYTDMTKTARVVTTDPTPVSVHNIVMPSTEIASYVADCRFIGHTATGVDVFLSYTIMINNDNGVIAVYGGGVPEYPMILIRDGSVSMDDCSMKTNVAGNVVSINIIGLVGATINWAGTIRVHRSVR